MTNIGADPIDATTMVGLLRYETGDVVGTATNTGFANYAYLSDAFLQGLIDAFPGSSSKALARALGSMASQMISAAQDIQVDDIRIKTVQKAQLMLDRANLLETNGEIWDAASAFAIVALTPTTNYHNSFYSDVPRFDGQGNPGIVGPSGF